MPMEKKMRKPNCLVSAANTILNRKFAYNKILSLQAYGVKIARGIEKCYDETMIEKNVKTIAENKRALFDYEVLEKYKAGIVLAGQEVKSVKLGRISLQGSFVVLRGEEPFLIGASIPPYQPKNLREAYTPTRSRKLLLRKAEIRHLIGASHQKGLTLVPLLVYTTQGKIKIEFAVAKSKKKADKRAKIKKREIDREINITLKGG